MSAAFIWPIERVDENGEPAPAGPFLKFGLRAFGESRTIWLDALDAEAVADAIRDLLGGGPLADRLAPFRCEVCGLGLAAGDLAYQSRPGGRRCLICRTCAPTIAEEDNLLCENLRGGRLPPGFASRNEAIAWRARIRAAYATSAKRLSPITAPAAEELIFPEPPPSARLITEESEDHDG